jgi:acetyl/propionyl-CoA carboxylase alpha subunit
VSASLPFQKIFVATRGEIALRIIRAARDLGIATAAAASGPERQLPFAEAAGQLLALPEGGNGEPYLDGRTLVALAKRAGAQAVHPGYGFLSESPEFAEACSRAGLIFIGPPPGALRATGDKIEARRAAARAGVPVLPGAPLPEGLSKRHAAREGSRIGYPLLIKAAAGGGGRGIRRAAGEADLLREIEAASREARAAFGDGRLYLEKELSEPRHVEVQLLADSRGRVAAFPERDCSVQRRHQKIIEESPSPAVAPALRARLARAAVKVARAVGYRNAGTVEFLVDARGRFYFLEVNARLQVEHPLTEMVTGEDLVAWQIRLAAGEALPAALAGRVARPVGHAVECRICAERPPRFTPSSGPLHLWRAPSGPGIRFDAGYREGNAVGTRFDSLLAKLIAWGPDRGAALARLESALGETVILGVDTTIDFLADAVRHPHFRSGRYDLRFVESLSSWSAPPPPPEVLRVAAEFLSRRAGPVARAERPPSTGVHRSPWEELGGLEVRA